MTGPGGPANGGFNPLSVLAGGNPAWRAAIGAAGVMSPTPADTGELPRQTLGRRPSGSNNLFATPSRGIGSDANAPLMGAGGFPTTYGAPGQQPAEPTPTGAPSQTPRPGGSSASSAPLPPRRPKNLGVTPSGNVAPASSSNNPLFGTFQTQVPGQGRGPLSSNPTFTTLNLPELFKRMRS
jgi:hypothetical protein